MASLEIIDSSLIREIDYNPDNKEMKIVFKENYYIVEEVYVNVSKEEFVEFLTANSLGKYYLSNIQHHYKLKKSQNMPDKVIKCKIDVMKVLKQWLFQGEKGTYLNFTILYNETKDQHGNNGMIVQDVPTEVYKADKETKGPILGNCKVFEKSGGASGSSEGKPGEESGKVGAAFDDDLPF